jgi:UDP:flavonoid glycosyltransferase YjiC (YdhE family)
LRILLIAFGTRGDVQPTIAIGKALKALGHEVGIFTSFNFEDWVIKHNLTFYRSSLDVKKMMQEGEGQDWAENGSKPIFQAKLMRKLVNQDGWLLSKELWQICQNMDMLISSFTSNTYVASMAEKLNIKHISLMFQPSLIASRSGMVLPKALFPNKTNFINYLFSKILIEPACWYLYGPLTNRIRKELLGLPLLNEREYLKRAKQTLTLHTYSNKIVPQPLDWPSSFHTTGYCFFDEDNQEWKAPKELIEFLDTKEPVISVGFGSMTGRNREHFSKQVLEAIKKVGCKAVLLSGWSEIKNNGSSKNIFEISHIPHRWLFQRVKAVVHHGGAGTTAAGLREGKPTVIVPHLGDQPFWGERIFQLGLGAKPIFRNELNATNLAKAIYTVISDQQIEKNAQTIAKELEKEDGLKQVVKFIENPF